MVLEPVWRGRGWDEHDCFSPNWNQMIMFMKCLCVLSSRVATDFLVLWLILLYSLSLCFLMSPRDVCSEPSWPDVGVLCIKTQMPTTIFPRDLIESHSGIFLFYILALVLVIIDLSLSFFVRPFLALIQHVVVSEADIISSMNRAWGFIFGPLKKWRWSGVGFSGGDLTHDGD